ncbi:MAG: ABC transporter ATP-binding protein [Anaerolineae bacterium]
MRLYLRFLKYVQPYWYLALAASTCLVASGYLGAYPIQLFKRAVDVAVGDAAGGTSTFYWLALEYILLRIGLGGVHLTESYLTRRLAQNVILDLRSDLYTHLQSLSIGFYEAKGAAEITSRAMGDVGALAGGFMGPLTRLAGELTQLAWALFFLMRIDPRLTLLSLAVAPPVGYAVYRFGGQMRDLAWRMRVAQSGFWSFLTENISGMREIQIFGRERYELDRFHSRAHQVDQLGTRDAILDAALTYLTGLLFSTGETVILLTGGLAAYQGKMTAGKLAAFLMYLRLLYNPVITLSRRYDQTLRTLASATRVFELLDTVPEVRDRPSARPLSAVRGEVRFEKVCFRYRPDQEVLQDVSFLAAPGEHVALVGHSGGGKTTISKLIPRFYDPDKGRVLVDGQDVRDVTLRSLRSQIAVVFQESFLFNGTVWENIAYGKAGATEKEILRAAKAANVHPFVMSLPEQYDSVVGERGVWLSGGQRQRIAIARALLKDPRILIMDEATSSVDSETEQLIQQALERLLCGRTSITIAHRLSTIVHADQILVIERGHIAERGSHDELLRLGGAYSRLYRAQVEGKGRIDG